ncbi:MAG: anaerobic ribonucleoside-triphosphate reductase activating protein, partial [Thermoplasmata archaeon]|nr:anaerobic ribonucleoside-triphosphate reductase activating protein [Thermoplasmata archaeon]
YEFRTTIIKNILTKEDIIDIAKTIKGSKLYVLQKFIHSKILDPSLAKRAKTFSDAELEAIRSEAEKYVKECVIR